GPREIFGLRVVEWLLVPSANVIGSPAAALPFLVRFFGVVANRFQQGLWVELVAVVIFDVTGLLKLENDEPEFLVVVRFGLRNYGSELIASRRISGQLQERSCASFSGEPVSGGNFDFRDVTQLHRSWSIHPRNFRLIRFLLGVVLRIVGF